MYMIYKKELIEKLAGFQLKKQTNQKRSLATVESIPTN